MQIKRDFFVNFRSVDAELRLTNSGILAMFEDIACLHGVQIGDDISVSDLRWLLIGYQININRRPRYGEEVRVTTWSKDYRNVTATREFEMHDADGSLLVVRQNGVSVTDLNRAIMDLQRGKAKMLGCVLNNVYSTGLLSGEGYGTGYGRYGGYSRYGRYGKYGRYGAYAAKKLEE